MKLVVDNTVTPLSVANVQDIAGCLRCLADDLEADFHGEVYTLISLLVRPDGIAIVTYGENASSYELMGLFEAAKLRVFADDVIED